MGLSEVEVPSFKKRLRPTTANGPLRKNESNPQRVMRSFRENDIRNDKRVP